MRSIALMCTATAMLGTVGVLASVAVLAGRSDEQAKELAAATAADTIRASVAAAARAEAIAPEPAPTVVVLSAPQPEAAPESSVVMLAADGRWARDVAASATVKLDDAIAGLSSAYGDARPSKPESAAWSAIRDDEAKLPAGNKVPKPEVESVERAAPAGGGMIKTAANMRAAPRNGAKVLATIPARSAVGVVACDIWCEVEHDGRRGFVIAKFVSRGGAAPQQSETGQERDLVTGSTRSAEAKPPVLTDTDNRGR